MGKGKLSGVTATCASLALCLLGIALPAGAQTYSRTETTTYKDDLSKWVLGQVATVTCNAYSPVNAGDNPCNGDVEVSITYNATSLLPEAITKFGKPQGTIAYNADGTIQAITDGNTNTTSFSSWKRGIPQTITYPATPDQPSGATESASVNNDGTIAYTTDENGYRTCYTSDPMGRLDTLTYPSEPAAKTCNTTAWAMTTQDFAPSTSARYGLAAGHWVQTIATGSGYKVIDYDAMWRPVVENTYINGVSSSYSITVKRYDTSGRLAFQSYPLASLSTYTDTTLKGTDTYYDALDRVTSVQQDSELGLLTTSTTYLSGFQTRVTNPRGFNTVTSYQTYDKPSMDWPVSIQAADGRPVEENTDILRDPFGKPLTITRHDPANTTVETRSYTYYTSQQLCRTVEPETGATLMGYDGAGNLAWSAAGLPSTTACDLEGDTAAILARKAARSYDARNRLKTLSFPDGRGDQEWTYKPDNLPNTITTYNDAAPASQVTNANTYNHRRLLVGESSQLGANTPRAIGYGYDANGHLSSQVWPDGTTAQFVPNALGQATKVDAGGNAYAWNASYYPNGALKSFNYGNGIVHTMTQNIRQLPDTSTDAYGTTKFISDSYDYDPNGNVAAITDGATGTAQRGNRTMSYDALDRLMAASSPMFGNGATGTASYSHDALDNLTYVSIPATASAPARNWYYCYDPTTWQLTNLKTGSCDGGVTVGGIGYDVQGNLNNKSGTLFDFDYGNRLRSATYSTATLESYQYDGYGRRVLSTASTGTIQSLYSQGGQLLYQDNARTGKRINYYYLAGSLVNEVETTVATGAVANRFQHTDALGSPVLVTDGARAQVGARTEYEPYGQILAGGVADRPNFTGHVNDAQTGLDYMQQRYYDPMLGRFLSVDPVTATSVGGNFNRYWYASDNPYRFIDPDGRDDEDAQKGRDAAEIQKKDDQRRADSGRGPGTHNGTLSQMGVNGDIAGSRNATNKPENPVVQAASSAWNFIKNRTSFTAEGAAAYGPGVAGEATKELGSADDSVGSHFVVGEGAMLAATANFRLFSFGNQEGKGSSGKLIVDPGSYLKIKLGAVIVAGVNIKFNGAGGGTVSVNLGLGAGEEVIIKPPTTLGFEKEL